MSGKLMAILPEVVVSRLLATTRTGVFQHGLESLAGAMEAALLPLQKAIRANTGRVSCVAWLLMQTRGADHNRQP